MFKKLLLFSWLALSFSTAKAIYVPVPVTGYNVDIVANGAGAATGSTSNVPGGTGTNRLLGNYSFMAADFNPSGTLFPTSFLPTNLTVNSATTPCLSWNLASYSGNNAIFLTTARSTDSLVFVTPSAAGEVDILGTSADGSAAISMTVNFTDGTNEVFTRTVDDWYNVTTGVAILGLGRADLNTPANGIGNDAGNPRLYEYKLMLSASNYAKLIRSVTFVKTATGNQEIVFMGVAINTVCSGTPVAGAITSSTGTSACSGVNFNLSLPCSNVGLGFTYQWQSSPTGSAPWSNITSATNVSYTANQTATTSYRAYLVCNGTAADTSAPITVTMKPANQCYCVATSTSPTYYISGFSTTGGSTNITNNGTLLGAGGYTDYTNLSVVALQGATINFTVTHPSSTYAYNIWVDWNQNGVFTDAGENVIANGTSYQSSPYSSSFAVPTSALPGVTRMRVRNAFTAAPSPVCGNATNGETEDYSFNVIQLLPCVTPTAQPTALSLTATSSTVTGGFTASSPAADAYLIVRSIGALTGSPVNGTSYTVGGALGNGTIVSTTNALAINDPNLIGGTTYTYNIFSYSVLCSGGPLYRTTTPLTGTVTTLPQGIYSWNGSVSTDWQIAGNWTPNRSVVDPGDILQFNGGATYNVNNIPTQTVRRITFTNNTTANFQVPAANTLTLNSDNVATTNELDIAGGSSMIINGTTAAMTVTFGGAGATGNIIGKLEVVNTATIAHTVNFTNSVTTVAAAGEIASGSAASSGANSFTGTATSLLINGTYNHKFTVNSGGGIPTASYNTGSTVLISGYTTSTGGPNGGFGQTLFNLTYNCPNQTAVNNNWSGPNPLNILGTLTVANTGAGQWQYSNTTAYNLNVNNFVQTGGIFDLSSGNTTGAQLMNITGNFTKSGGTFKATNTTGNPTLNFTGTTAQTATFNDVPAGRIVYRFANNAGVTFVGTGGLSTFNINDNGGIRVSTTATNPLTTSMTIAYGTTGSTLTYDTTGSYTMTANVFPTAAGPQNLTINTGASTNVVTMPFSRTIPGTLNMTSGDIAAGANTLTLGTSATAAGTLTYTAGNVRLTTGSMVRWFGTTALPTTAANTGLFPVSNGVLSRAVNVYYSAATALSTGGTIAVGHSNAVGLTTGLSVADGAYTITQRTNASWSLTTGNGLAASGTLSVRLLGTGLFTALNPSNLRVMQASAVVGTHAAGSAPAYAIRTGLAVADLSAPLHVGAAGADIAGAYIAINNGNWSAGTTWDVGSAPGVQNDAYINPNVTVTADAATNTAKSLNILANGILNVNTGTVTIDSTVLNNGRIAVGGGTFTVNGNTGASGIVNNAASMFNLSSGNVNIGLATNGKVFTNSGTTTISGGTLTLGTAGGGNAILTNNGSATMNVTGGTVVVNGSINCIAASIFSQTGGDIKVDGNAAGVATNSVASGTAIVSFKSQFLTLTGGNLMIVDPHANTTATNTLEYSNSTAHVNALPPHTLILGDGVSTDAGGNATNAFRLNTWPGSNRISFGHMIVNGPTGTNRYVTNTYGYGINGNLTVNNGGELRMTSTLYLTGNLNVNTGGTFTTQSNSLYYATFLGGVTGFSPAAQTVNNQGIIRNSTGTVTANVYNSYFYNTFGVTFNQDHSFSNNLYCNANSGVPSKAIMSGTNKMIEISGAGGSNTVGATSGWVAGRYQKATATGGVNHNFPIGDINYYTPVNVSGTALTAGQIVANSIPIDHPNIATSTINPLATVNRYFTIDTLGGVTFTAASMSATFNWVTQDNDPMVNASNFIIGNRGTTWTYPTPSNAGVTTIKANGLTNDIAGQFAVGEPCGPIAIARQPVNATGCIGGSVSFSVGMTPKSGVSYQWRKGTTNIAGATDSIYTIPSLVAGDAGTYSVVISSGCASVTPLTSTAATLTINTPPSVTTPPTATMDICEGRPAVFSVTAGGTGVTYQWKKGGIAITGATSATYTIPVASTSDAGTYSVDVIGAAPCGTITSANSVLTIKPLPLTITAATATNFCVGGSVVLNAPTTPSTLTYQWRNGTGNIAGQTANAYTATTTGNYRAIITNTANGCSDTSNTIAVNASGAPQAIISPTPTASFCQGSSIILHGNNTPGLTYQWILNGGTTPVGTDSTLVATAAGSYVLKVFIGAGCSTTSTATVVTETPLPSVTTTPTGAQAICAGDTLTMTAFYTGATAVWKFNGAPVTPAATGTTYKATAAGAYTVTITSTSTGCSNTSAPVNLTLNALPTITATSVNAATFCEGATDTLRATPATGLNYVWNRNGSPVTPAANTFQYVATQSGTYTVTATNPTTGCSRTSTGIVVTANPLPNVLVTPSLPLAMCSGQTNNLCIPAVTGVGYQWKNGGVNIAGATSACYAVTAAGTYSVTATTAATGCSATSTVSTVTVNPTPTATITNTGSGVACAGDTICLNANTGAGLTYQWKVNGGNIPGATASTYCATGTGNYTVEVTNGSNCSATSSILTLTYNPRPSATISYTTPITFCEGGAVVLTGVSNTGTTYQWQNNANPITGATSNNYIASATGSYSVVITAPNGCKTTSPTILVVVNPIPNPVITRVGNLLTTGAYASYQWYFNSAPIAGATNQSFNFSQNGGYEVAVTDANGCMNYSGVMLIGNVSVGTLTPASIKVFPNPAHHIVTISAPAQVNVVVRDLTGRLVMKEDNAKQINVSNLADGSYIMMITDKNGTMIKTEKLLKVSE